MTTWPAVSGRSTNDAVLLGVLPRIDAIRALHADDSEPDSPVAYMLWAAPTAGLLRQRNATNDGWIDVGPLLTPVATAMLVGLGSVSATGTRFALSLPTKYVVSGLMVISDTATSGSDASNNWAWQLHNVTQALDLFSTAPDTNGDELAVDTPKVLVPDQNLSLAARDVLEFRWTKTGAPTSPLGEVAIAIEGCQVG